MQQHGFSLLEMLVALIILGIISLLGTFSYQHFFADKTEMLLQHKLTEAIRIAHRKAQTQGIRVGLCPSANQQICEGEWQQGLLIFVDSKKDGTIHNQNQIIARIPGTTQGHLYWRAYPHYRHYLALMPDGKTDNGTFWFCPLHAKSASWLMKINRYGLTRIIPADKNNLLPC